jgi:hypothetical protein
MRNSIADVAAEMAARKFNRYMYIKITNVNTVKPV